MNGDERYPVGLWIHDYAAQYATAELVAILVQERNSLEKAATSSDWRKVFFPWVGGKWILRPQPGVVQAFLFQPDPEEQPAWACWGDVEGECTGVTVGDGSRTRPSVVGFQSSPNALGHADCAQRTELTGESGLQAGEAGPWSINSRCLLCLGGVHQAN